MSDKDNILPFDNGNEAKRKLSEDNLMAYLEGKLSPAEQHDVEQWLAEEGMESDALEGLHTLAPGEARHSVNRLNHDLHRTIFSKKRRRRPLKNDHIAWIAIAVILFLIVVAYLVIRKSI